MSAPKTESLAEFTLPMTVEQAEAIYAQGPESVVFVMMQLAKLAEQAKDSSVSSRPALSTPSAMVPVFQKPTISKRRRKPGAKPGHQGARRHAPEKVDREVVHEAPARCPDCGARLTPSAKRRFRLIEEVEQVTPVVTRHVIGSARCPKCKRRVEPPVPDALSKSQVGHRLVALTAWLHYGLGITLSRVAEVLNYHLRFQLTQGGMTAMWYRLAAILRVWYDAIAEEAICSGVLHADETGWRVNGKTHWLWCFTNRNATYYMIERSRGSPALSKFFTTTFDGILVTDFWAAYRAVAGGGQQACLAHLFRELAKVDDSNPSESWRAFAKKLKRLLRDGLRLRRRRAELPPDVFAGRKARMHSRLEALLRLSAEDADVRRLIKRLTRYRDAIFTFLDHEDVPSDNNHAEREIRPAVLMRKNSFCNRSDQGAKTQAILMSVYRTLKVRGHNPLDVIVSALREYVQTGLLPPLPKSHPELG